MTDEKDQKTQPYPLISSIIWTDINNMNAKAPFVGEAIYIKILNLPFQGLSKIYTKDKLDTFWLSSNITNISAKQDNHLSNSRKEPPSNPKTEKKDVTDPQENRGTESGKRNEKQAGLKGFSEQELEKKRQYEQEDQKNLERQKEQEKQRELDRQRDIEKQRELEKQRDSEKRDLEKQKEFEKQKELERLRDEEKLKQEKSESTVIIQPNTSEDLFCFDHSDPIPCAQPQNVQKSPQKQESLWEFDEAEHQQIDPQSNQLLNLAEQRQVQRQVDEKVKQLHSIWKNEQINVENRLQAQSKLQGKITNWSTKDKVRNNIGTLLMTLHEILWQDSSWEPVGVFEVMHEEKLKKNYYKAIRFVHPNNHQNANPEQRYIAEQVFYELNQAWNEKRKKN